MRSIRVFAPATVANVAAGFDILGFAVHEPGDIVEAKLSREPGVRIAKILGNGAALPKDADKNSAGVSVLGLRAHLKEKRGVDLVLHKNMPIGSGLGSSAASGVASLFAVNELLGRPLTREQLLPFAMEAERVCCGTAHADNVGPCLFGGFVLIRSYNPLDVVSVPTPDGLLAAIVHPDIEVRTQDARNILKKQILLKDAIVQWGNTAGLVAGLMKSDFALIGRSLQDVIIEPVRSMLIPGFDEVKNAALAGGALGCSISGSGPSMFALCDAKKTAEKVSRVMQEAFKKNKLDSEAYVSRVNKQGPVVLT